jgi:hypothetical protein
MAASKTFLAQIPIETVKRIAKEFPEENAVGSDGENNAETPGEVRSPRESWREVAEKVQDERDPKRMMGLVEELIATLDQEQLRKRPTCKLGGENRSD